ncbi:4-carboxymuconolactone decarboxylase [Agreia sp. Leaf244]|uniref:carboxymuconolactone decarboxylase family protein n=1 Tax=Agreia sp. Leaf244 TaxID=1736305 RepID=UPI0006F847BB|nr:carboxymuconolactone decarboxylase family protein [Agreia sp. Leaf244]KQO07628.1 4-carboxymuconolactone decarboxylase [Agreia sp. Leaf244]
MTDTSQTPAPQSAAQRLVGDIAPKLAELTDDVLFGDVWERQALAKRDRSLVTISALITSGAFEQLRSHLPIGRTNGLGREELVETIIHLAFYAGWPKAMSAIEVAREVFSAEPSREK